MTSLEYLAGILDVGGSLGITDRKGRPGVRVFFQIQSKHRELPEAFSERFGGEVVSVEVSNGTRWVWQKTGKAAQEVLRELRPFVRIRGQDFDRLLSVNLRNRGGSHRLPQKSIGAELQEMSR